MSQIATKPELTPRMTQVLLAIANGHKNQDIAQHLGLSIKTVEKHRQKLLEAFKVDNAVSLVTSAIRQGLVKL